MVFYMCFSTGKLARPQWEGGFGFLGGFSTRKGSWGGLGGALVVMLKRGWLLSEQCGTTLHKRGHLSLHQLLSDSRGDKSPTTNQNDDKQNCSPVGQPSQAKAVHLQQEEEEDGRVRGGDGQHCQ